jgi:hypothetical protein
MSGAAYSVFRAVSTGAGAVRTGAGAVRTGASDAMKRTKHTLVTSVLGRVDASVDPLFDAQQAAGSRLEKLQAEMRAKFDRIVDCFETIGKESTELCDLLAQLRRECDEDGIDRQEASPDLRQANDLSERLAAATAELTSLSKMVATTLGSSCCRVLDDSLTTLTGDGRAARQAVHHSQIRYDNARSDVVAAAQTVEAAEVNLRNVNFDGFRQDYQLAREALVRKQAREDAAAAEYNTAVQEGHSTFIFLFQQASMTTWSCYNVFFTELSNYFAEARDVSHRMSATLKQLKNSQWIARQLTAERSMRLDRERRLAEEERGTPPPPPPAVPPPMAAESPRPLDAAEQLPGALSFVDDDDDDANNDTNGHAPPNARPQRLAPPPVPQLQRSPPSTGHTSPTAEQQSAARTFDFDELFS